MSGDNPTVSMGSFAEYILTVGGGPVPLYENVAEVPTGAMQLVFGVSRGFPAVSPATVGNLSVQLTWNKKHTFTLALPASVSEQSIALLLFGVNSLSAVVISDAPADAGRQVTLFLDGLSQVVSPCLKEKSHHC